MMAAAIKGRFEVVPRLLDAGADVNFALWVRWSGSESHP